MVSSRCTHFEKVGKSKHKGRVPKAKRTLRDKRPKENKHDRFDE